MYHNGTNTYFENVTGDWYFDNHSNDKDIIFRNDDGSGGVTTYMYLDGSYVGTRFPQNVQLDDNVELRLGTNQDLRLEHTGSNGTITNYTGNLTISNTTDDGDIIFQSDDGSGGVETYFFLDGSYGANPYTIFPDNSTLAFGTNRDLLIVHDATDSKIDNNTGDLKIRNFADDGDIIFQSDDGSGGVETYFFLDGSAGAGTPITNFPDGSYLTFGGSQDIQMFHDGTNNYLQATTGDLYIRNLTDDKDIIFQSDDGSGGVATYLTLDGGVGRVVVKKRLRCDDNVEVQLGAGGDLSLKHVSDQSYIDNSTGNLNIRQKADDKDIVFQCDDGAGGDATYFFLDGSASLTKFNVNTKHLDNVVGYFGDSNDLQLFHNGSNSFIQASGVGDLYISNYNNDKDIIFQSDDGSGSATPYLTLDGSAGTIEVAKEMNLAVSLATDQQKHLAWFEIAGFGTGDGTNYEISVNLDNDTAPFSHNVSTGANGTTAITVQNIMRSGGTVMTRAGTIKRWTGWATTAGSSTANVALFKITPARNDNSDVAPVLIDNVSYTAVGNAKMLDFNETSFTDASVAAGDIVVTGIKCEDTKTTYFSSTLEIEF